MMTAVQPMILEIIGLVVSALLAWGVKLLRDKTKLDVEDKHRKALHEAIMSGVEAALGDDPVQRRVSMEHVKERVRDHVYDSVPEAVTHLIPGDTVLDTIAERYANQLLRSLIK